MNNPNLQQIPARNKDLGPRIRSLFIPEEGCKWGCFDYNQQEPRLVVHYAALQGFYSVEDVVEAYKNENADFHQIVADMADIGRFQAKTINLGLFYGMGKNKLQAELGINKLQAEDLFKQYHSKVPFVKQLMDAVMSRMNNVVKLERFWVDYVGFIYGNRISSVSTNHCLMMQRCRNTDQGSEEHTHTKL